ncbi:MAG: hypothetical protein ACLFVW_09480 [Phycisphaerae bacterium]
MIEEHREIVGFLCRWLLLAMVGAILLGAAWAGALATEAIAVETAARVVMPDGIARQRHNVWLVGYVRPRLPYSASTALLYQRGRAGDPRSASVRGGKVNWYPAVGDAGLERFEFRGQPHGPLATQRCAVRLLTVSAHETVWLIDADWANRLSQDRGNELAGLLARLDARGAIAMFHTGPLNAFESCRDELRDKGFQYPILLELRDNGGPAYILRRTSRRIRRWEHNRDMFVITDDGEFARSAVEDGFRTHRVGEDSQPRVQSRLLTAHGSFDELKENLTTLPIP